MSALFRYSLLGTYWALLTKSLLTSSPWSLFSANLAQHPPIDLSFEPFSWITHLLAYGTLGLFIQWATHSQKKWIFNSLWSLAIFHSLLCEALQAYIPGRWPNAWDAVFNGVGLIMAFALHTNPGNALQHRLSNIFLKKPVA